MRVTRALAETRLPICLANVQPVPAVTTSWDMGDLTYNQGIHGAQDTANAMVRAGRRFTVVTDDWRSSAFRDAIGLWARAAAAVTRWRELRIAVIGYAMNGMGDIRVDEHALLRALGPQVDALAPGVLHRAAEHVSEDEVAALIGDDSIGRGIVETLHGHRSPAVLMRNHGVFTIGRSARDAVKAAVMCEDAARVVFAARSLGPLVPLDPESIDALYHRYQNVYGQH
jgi:hypothetical protein